ncbi:T7SS effector LXG polymorphic toxin [Psychrobacillus vulpis]|uniref:LXG domain-containing protein n=1 Tax=Psychrobacillus vulpis TaxID=2325572 RepID=A0A544TNZ3_9BACI|nr:T7SS effector LXG polymorphic toxin [Psychrobacillus vulpis]TQR19178.1 hypothetical protein FG384_14335 [Psychrobacillus vulpis]
MKVLDVDLFQDWLHRNLAMLDRLGSEIEVIHRAVLGLVQMEDQLKGEGGNAIRSFYGECHLPFLQFFQLFSEHYKQVLQQMEAALYSLEPDSAGYILEQFLEGELEQGLTLIGKLTANLTDETNNIMDQVSDIVGLPHLDDSGVQEGVIHSKRKRDDTVTHLHEFDATQTNALNPIEQDLQAMGTWLTDIEGLFKAGVRDITFESNQWDVLTFRSEIRTELFPKVYLNPSNLWIEEHEQLIGTMITATTFQTLEGKKVNTVEENLDENIKYHLYENGLLIKEYSVGQTVFYEVVSKVEYKEESGQAEKPKGSNGLDHFQTGLDLAGLIPGVGEIADGVNGIIYSFRGDATNAALSFGAMIPFLGWASTGGKFAKKGNDLYQARNVVSTEKMESVYSPIYQDVVNSPLGKTQSQLDVLSNTRYQFGTPNALTFSMPSVKTDIPTTIKSGDVEVKTTEGIAKNLNKDQLKVIEDIETGRISLETTKHKGNYGEMKMDVHFESQGYTRISLNRVTSLDDKIVQGIDGVYENSGLPPKYIIGEAKYGISQLSNTKTGKQMSEEWVDSRNRLDKALGREKADEIRMELLLNPENIESVLVKVGKDGEVSQLILDEFGKIKK